MDCGRNGGWRRWTYRGNLGPSRHRREAARLAESSREHCGYLKRLLRRFCDQLLMQKEDERRWVEGDGALRLRVRKALREGTLGPVSGCDLSRSIPFATAALSTNANSTRIYVGFITYLHLDLFLVISRIFAVISENSHLRPRPSQLPTGD